MKTIEEKFEEWFKSYFEGFHTSNPDECVEVFKAGYELAKIEYEAKLKEAIDLLEQSLDLSNPYGSSEDYDYKTKTYKFLESQSEISK